MGCAWSAESPQETAARPLSIEGFVEAQANLSRQGGGVAARSISVFGKVEVSPSYRLTRELSIEGSLRLEQVRDLTPMPDKPISDYRLVWAINSVNFGTSRFSCRPGTSMLKLKESLSMSLVLG